MYAPNLKLFPVDLPRPGYQGVFGAYVFTGQKSAVIDPGPAATAGRLLADLAAAGTDPKTIKYIILTHIHLDHAGAAGDFLKAAPQAMVVAHPRARPHLLAPARLWEASLRTLGDMAIAYGPLPPLPGERILDAADGLRLDLGNSLVLETYLTPGHAPHHISVFEPAGRVLIAGETAGVAVDSGLRVATSPPFRLNDELASIEKLRALGAQKICYAHFGCFENTPDRLERMRQKVLLWRDIVLNETRAGKSPEQIMSAIRARDRDLDYLGSLNHDDFEREKTFILRDIGGLAET